MIPKQKSTWTASDEAQAKEARSKLQVWPLDEYNAALLNQVHPIDFESSEPPHEIYDLIAVGAGAGGLVSSKQVSEKHMSAIKLYSASRTCPVESISTTFVVPVIVTRKAARRGAKSAMISENLAGGDCLNVGCVPSKALIRSARAIREVRRASEFGVVLPNGPISIDFGVIMKRMREKRAAIAPADGHEGTMDAGAQVFQGRGRFTGPNTIEVNGKILQFRKAVIATGGRPAIPKVPGLADAPYTTNEILFNLEALPPRMVILGAGVIALEMAQTFATFGSDVTVIQRSERLFQSKGGDKEAAKILQTVLEEDGVMFLTGTTKQVTTLRSRGDGPDDFPLLKLTVSNNEGDSELECECLLVATGRVANVENLGLEEAGVDYEPGKGIVVNDLSQSVGNKDVFGVGDCVAGVPRLTHMSGEMAKVVIQNALFDDDWKLSSLIVPAVAYTEPEYATVGLFAEDAASKASIDVDVYRTSLEHNDRAITESDTNGICKILCKKGTDEIVGATIVASRAGELINEVTLAMKHGIGLGGIGRNIHSYPTTGEAIMGCGLQFINARWKRLDH